MTFEIARRLEDYHLLVLPSDARLNPPQSYLFVQDFLILSCAMAYCFCYLFYIKQTRRDRFLAGPIDLLFGNLAYEIYFPFIVATSSFQFLGSLVWFFMDVWLNYTAIKYACPPEKRFGVIVRTLLSTIAGVVFLRVMGQLFPSEREQVTAYWTGWLLELPVGWNAVNCLYQHKHTKGQSLEIWAMRLFGVFMAISVFLWRYVNVPQNWAFVVSWQSIVLFILTIIPEIAYPFVYIATLKNATQKSD